MRRLISADTSSMGSRNCQAISRHASLSPARSNRVSSPGATFTSLSVWHSAAKRCTLPDVLREPSLRRPRGPALRAQRLPRLSYNTQPGRTKRRPKRPTMRATPAVRSSPCPAGITTMNAMKNTATENVKIAATSSRHRDRSRATTCSSRPTAASPSPPPSSVARPSSPEAADASRLVVMVHSGASRPSTRWRMTSSGRPAASSRSSDRGNPRARRRGSSRARRARGSPSSLRALFGLCLWKPCCCSAAPRSRLGIDTGHISAEGWLTVLPSGAPGAIDVLLVGPSTQKVAKKDRTPSTTDRPAAPAGARCGTRGVAPGSSWRCGEHA